jgi:serine/threonine protein kinase
MTDELDLCPGCFLEPRTSERCQRCGFEDDPGAFASALQPGTVLTKYTLGRVLGKPGGFGITYLAFDRVLQRRVAIKELMPRELVARRPDGNTLHVHTRQDAEFFAQTLGSFLKEARLLAQFSHPNVVRVLDYFEANGTAYFAMEYYEGQTLAEYAQGKGGKLSGPEAVAMMLPLLDALDHIHSLPEPILHRDIKPHNIYLAGKKTPILLDFGAARVALSQQSRSLSAVLTPGFAPYEQYSTRGNQGPWSDVYGCAATLYYLVAGRVPPDASQRFDDRRVEPPRTYAPDLTPQLNDAIVAGLGFTPDERPQTARAFAQLLSGQPVPLGATERAPIPQPVLGPTEVAPGGGHQVARTLVREPERVPPLPSPPPPPRPATRPSSRLPIAIAAVVVLLVAGTVAATVWRNSKPPEPVPIVKERSEPPVREDKQPPERSEARDRVAPPPTPPTEAIAKTPPARTERTPDDSTRAGRRTAAATTVATSSPPQPAVPPPTAVLVVILGDDPDAARQAESVILRAVAGQSGLQALEPESLSMLRGDQAALQAAAAGNFTALAAMGRQHGVELMVVGDLRSRATPSINRFYTGTAELNVKTYRTSTGRVVDAQTFIVGPGGTQPVLAINDIEARSRAAAQAANAAADAIARLGRQ